MTESPRESSVLRAILLAVSKVGARLFRNQVGAYRIARPTCIECQRFGRVLRSGLCVGSSDLIGWRPVTVTQDMVGQRLAVFVALEVKRLDGGRTSDEQAAFVAAVQRAGGIAAVVRSDAEAVDALR